jgi:hypothetical protein
VSRASLPQRLRADLAAQAHPCPTPKRDLDDALAIRPPRPIVDALTAQAEIAWLKFQLAR